MSFLQDTLQQFCMLDAPSSRRLLGAWSTFVGWIFTVTTKSSVTVIMVLVAHVGTQSCEKGVEDGAQSHCLMIIWQEVQDPVVMGWCILWGVWRWTCWEWPWSLVHICTLSLQVSQGSMKHKKMSSSMDLLAFQWTGVSLVGNGFDVRKD